MAQEANENTDSTPTIQEVLEAMDPMEQIMWARVVDRAKLVKQEKIIQSLEQMVHTLHNSPPLKDKEN